MPLETDRPIEKSYVVIMYWHKDDDPMGPAVPYLAEADLKM